MATTVWGTNNKSDIGYDCIEIEDGVIVAGAQTASGSTTQERWLTKLNKDTGAQIWERYYSIDQLGQEQRNDFVADAIHEVLYGSDGMLYATGYLGAEQTFMAWDMKIDPVSGELIDENIMSNQGICSVVESMVELCDTYNSDNMGISFFETLFANFIRVQKESLKTNQGGVILVSMRPMVWEEVWSLLVIFPWR